MSADLRLLATCAVALIVTMFAVPVAIAVATGWGLLDHPRGWKPHVRPTPYLGGAAALCGLSIAVIVFDGGFRGLAWLLMCCAGLCVLGTLDDRRDLAASARLIVTMAAAVLMWKVGLGWSVFSSGAADLIVTVIWVVAVVNAVNLLDLLDGAAASTVAACAAGCAALALVFSDIASAGIAVAICGSCLGFLRFNLRSPSAIFLGDGGTMPLGLLTAVSTETLSWGSGHGIAAISGGVLLCGLPMFDMTFRVFSRLRRGDTLLTAGPDSIANWLRARTPSARWVAATLALAQGTIGAVVVLAANVGFDALLVAGLCAVLIGACLIVLLDASGFGRHLLADRPPTAPRARARRRSATATGVSNEPA